MAKKFEYTTLAHRYAARFPLLTYVGTHTNFWIIANLLLAIIMHLTSQIIRHTFQVSVTGRLAPMMLIAVILGVGYGVILGLGNYYLDHRFFRSWHLEK